MRLLKPGTKVILHEGPPGEPSATVEGTIASIRIWSDLSVSYCVDWWDNRRLESNTFTPQMITEPPDAQYITVDLNAVRID